MPKDSNQTLIVKTPISDINKSDKNKEKSEIVKTALELGYIIIEEKEYKIYQ
jgi:hypothetical protein